MWCVLGYHHADRKNCISSRVALRPGHDGSALGLYDQLEISLPRYIWCNSVFMMLYMMCFIRFLMLYDVIYHLSWCLWCDVFWYDTWYVIADIQKTYYIDKIILPYAVDGDIQTKQKFHSGIPSDEFSMILFYDVLCSIWCVLWSIWCVLW